MGRVMRAHAISAVIPTYNRRDYICRAIESIVGDNSAPNEILVIDDGSTDGTADLVRERFGAAVRVIRQPNAGVSAARRNGVLAATGDWIAFLDSDDEWVKGRCQAFTQAVARAPDDVSWIFGDTQVVQDDGEDATLFGDHGFRCESDFQVLDDALRSQYPFQFTLLQSSVIRRDAIMAAGNFGEGLTSSEDFLLGFRLALRSRLAAVPQVVTRLYRTGDLIDSSLDRLGRHSRDFHRARMLAFREAAEVRSPKPWGDLYAGAVRRFIIATAPGDPLDLGVAREQFRFGASPRSLAFHAALGPAGIRLWRGLSRATKRAAGS
jgi:glycosyltransferase involved in cell wall biosynthesis